METPQNKKISTVISHRDELDRLYKVESDPDFILKLKSPNFDELNAAFDRKPELALGFEEISETVQDNIVKKHPENIRYILNPTKRTEWYVTYRGFTDSGFRGNYYWKLAQKKPSSLLDRILIHPFLAFFINTYPIFYSMSPSSGYSNKTTEREEKERENLSTGDFYSTKDF